MCRPTQYVYTCQHRMSLGTQRCIFRTRIHSAPSPSLLSPHKELQLLSECRKDTKLGFQNNMLGHPCGRCEYNGLSQSESSSGGVDC